jgi:hypothetical protein
MSNFNSKPAYVHKPGTGSISARGEKQHEKSPDYKGEIVLDQDYKAGETLKLNGWMNQYSWGTRIGLRIDNWKPDPNYKKGEPREVRSRDEIDSEVPF